MKVLFITYLILNYSCFVGFVSAQQVSTEVKTIPYTDGREVFSICKSNPAFQVNDELEYYWYNEYSGIQMTKGGIGGQLLHGKYQLFGTKGNLVKEANFYLGLQNGLTRTWDNEGEIKETLKFQKGVCIYYKFLNEEGYIIEWIGEIFEVNSIKKVYTKYGRLLQESTCIDPFKYHIKNYYEENSSQTLESEYTSGVGDYYYGSYKAFYINGNLKIKGVFNENQKEGDWIYYNEDGSVNQVLKYIIYKEYYSNGNLKVQGSRFFDDNSNSWIKDGRWLYYEANGKDYSKIEEYEYGNLVSTY